MTTITVTMRTALSVPVTVMPALGARLEKVVARVVARVDTSIVTV